MTDWTRVCTTHWCEPSFGDECVFCTLERVQVTFSICEALDRPIDITAPSTEHTGPAGEGEKP